MNNMRVRTTLIIIVIILLAGAGAYYYLQQNKAAVSSGQSIDEVINNSVDITDLTTNLATNNYVKMSFKIQTDSKNAKNELTKRDFQIKNIMIEELSDTKDEDLQGKAGKVKLEETLKERINQIMQDGKVVQVYITASLLQ
ncbi:MAG: flagellar basal body-associated protein FliL [Bacillota bacterium]|nr:flagellar basal body-associated protein FliL [Bacillota bacterium]